MKNLLRKVSFSRISQAATLEFALLLANESYQNRLRKQHLLPSQLIGWLDSKDIADKGQLANIS